MKTKLFALLLFFRFISQAAYSQTTLSGTVTDKSGEKLPGITIVVANSKTGASTDIEGQYKLELSGSSDNLVITGIGYKTLKKEISLSSGQQTLDILMEDDVLALNQVVVTATFGTKSQKDSPISMSYLGAKQLATLSANSQVF
jgi:iron complex outermembrane recepter protein